MNYLGITQTTYEYIHYVVCLDDLGIAQELHRKYLGITQELLGNYLGITWELLRNYLGITQELLRNYLGITQELLRLLMNIYIMQFYLKYLGNTQ